VTYLNTAFYTNNSSFKIVSASGELFLGRYYERSDCGYAWHDAIQIKGSVYHSNCVDLVAKGLCVTAAMPMDGCQLDSHFADFTFFLYFLSISGLRVTFMGCVRLALA